MSNKMNGKDFLVGAMVGSVIGAVTALLLAPKSGRELRKDIADQAQQLSDKTQKIAGNIGHQTSEWFGKAKEVAGTVVEEVKAWKEAGKEVAVTALEEAEGKVAEERAKLEADMEESKKE
ncbi:Gas vesicle protein [Chlamydia abortus]|uniref:YtxH domain-containing protein n=1 Tax=Paenibacillus residui TaxID=629724 RepID=A0ABW3DC16_9BACL|nr:MULTISPECIES: YtxH domain-containing protein [Paenibacillaceae]SHE09958.1 Gas vesicle protein [Chlamydia abortus]